MKWIVIPAKRLQISYEISVPNYVQEYPEALNLYKFLQNLFSLSGASTVYAQGIASTDPSNAHDLGCKCRA